MPPQWSFDTKGKEDIFALALRLEPKKRVCGAIAAACRVEAVRAGVVKRSARERR